MAVSGTVLLLAFRCQKSTQFFTINHNSESSPQILRSCITMDGKRREKKKKRVHFAEDVVDHDPSRNGEVFRRECRKSMRLNQDYCQLENTKKNRNIPANRMALYNGILRDRVHRTTCSY
ncbi:Cytochrome p450 family protein [Thalictrum thalictroides]|uniref:Cytochrome p450 family protein n=1 Tax=Thalictrum thalictroides TaxID=46969 RepID=A0A7J6WVR9_THATH|nr:Cytochrome p450 family protein [Thalictrum thalictroides]